MADRLPDADAREEILFNLDANLVVEAAAGTGKTTSLVGRLMNLFRRGALAGESRLAAVTFTHKAAAELRERLDKELAKALQNPAALAADEAANLRAAALALPECHIGTIHSFCGRLLRERPVEAGVGPDFQELDDVEDSRYRLQAWSEFAGRLQQGDYPGLARVFETFGLDQDVLAKGFIAFAEYPDVDAWVGRDADPDAIAVAPFVAALDAYRDRFSRLLPGLRDADPGSDEILAALQILDARLERLPRPLDVTQAHRLATLFKKKPRTNQGQWAQFGLDKAAVKEAIENHRLFAEQEVTPFRDACLAAVYASALRAFDAAKTIYDRLRRDNRVLNFQDLLLRAAALLRDFPEVRDDLADRYARLLVDEVQDTDPVQAEIMFLLAAAPGQSGPWRDRRLRRGALFMVGDPKQSIYRFRRADIQIYQEMKRLVAEQGGSVLGLSANFRSRPGIVDWVNRNFLQEDCDGKSPEWLAACRRFAPVDTEYAPAYIPLEAGLPAAPEGCFSGVYSLEMIDVDGKRGIGERDVRADEARRIAAFVADAVERGVRIPDQGGMRAATPGDFLVVTYGKAHGNAYARALRARGLTCQVSCGGTLADSSTLCLLRDYLLALAFPDDPPQLLAVLRGELYGISDVELYRWKKAGRRFSILAGGDAADSPVGRALAGMARYHADFARREPVTVISRVVDDLGLWAHSSLSDDPAVSAGALAAALDLLGRERRRLPTLGHAVAHLEWLVENHADDPAPVRVRPGTAVRIMNMHKTKGLEAPVVFLTGTRRVSDHPAAIAVRRGAEGIVGAMTVYGGEHGNVALAKPPGWEEMAAREELFLAAEKTRLNYVAATRAGAALVVSIHQANKTWQSKFLPECRRGVTIEKLLPEPEASPPPPCQPHRIDADALERMAVERRERRAAMLAESYRTARAKPEDDPSRRVDEEAMDRGEVLHRLLASGSAANAAAAAAELLREFGLPVDEAGELAAMTARVRESALWRRAEMSGRALRETPYSLRLDDASVQRGVVDLAFREADGWVIVDYKSDAVDPGSAAARAAERHAGQLAAYAAAWRALTGEAVKEAGIYFLRPGEYVAVPAALE